MQCCISRLLLILGIALVLPQGAQANTESCTEAHASGQRDENAGHLKEALASFQECASDAACPLPIRNECTELYTTVERRLPTIVFSVVDESGNDVVDVKVSSADLGIASGLDGRPVAVNPGLHSFRFELPGGEVLSKSVVVRQGEKDRVVSVRLPRGDLGASLSAGISTSEPATPTGAQPKARMRVPLGAWISYGVGVAALGSWGTFGLLGRSQEKELVECSPNCQATRREDYDAMKRNYLIADVSLAIAGAGAVAGTIMLLTMGRKTGESGDRAAKGRAQRKLSLAPAMLGRSGGLLTLEGRY